MRNRIIALLMAFFGAFCFYAIYLGGSFLTSCKPTKNYSMVEYASETDNKFYQKMTQMERNSTLIFNGFPTSLTSILSLNTVPGDTITNAGDSTLVLVSRDLNREDINKYPYYIIKDKHENIWKLSRHNDEFHLTRLDKTQE